VNDFLATIVARTRERVRDMPVVRPAAARVPFAFSKAISGGQPPSAVRVIAEIKSASPSAGSIVEKPNVEEIARDYARGGAAAISIVTEPDFFHGSDEWIARAASASGLPIVMKDFIIDERQLLCGIGVGANAILLLASLLDAKQIRQSIALLDNFGCDALVEVHDETELERAIAGGARVIGVNNRNLRDFQVDLATAENLGARMPDDVIKVAESGIKTRHDVDRLRAAGFHAFLVGESLLRQNDRAAAVQALIT
jgi:indole-3-glycerol phosphate synthase